MDSLYQKFILLLTKIFGKKLYNILYLYLLYYILFDIFSNCNYIVQILNIKLLVVIFCRHLLKDALPLTEEHFVIGNTPANLRLGLDIGGTDTNAWHNSNIELTSTQILADVTNPPSSYFYDYLEVDL